MTVWVSQAQAAEILGCHLSNIPKLIAKGHLTSHASTNRKLPSLDRAEVEALAQRRAEERQAREARSSRRRSDPPDTDHDWLTVPQVAQLLGVTKRAVQGRIERERLSATRSGNRFWVRRDLLEQVEAARLVRKTRRP